MKQDFSEWGLSQAKARGLRARVRQLCSEFVDRYTGLVNTTELAEGVAFEFEHDEWLDDETHPLWDMVVEIAQSYERMHGGD